MNHIYKVIWNTITQTWVAVSELSRAKGKTKSSKTLSAVVLAAVSAGAIIGDAEAAALTGDGNGIAIQSQKNSSNGAFARADNVTSTAIGYLVVAESDHALAIGSQTQAIGEKTVAIGHLSKATGSESTALGVKAEAKGNGDIALGKHAVAQGGANGVTGSAALGDEAKATGAQSAAVGGKSNASGSHAVASGYNTQATGGSSSAIGDAAEASGDQSTAVGVSSEAKGNQSAALGMQAHAHGSGSIAAGVASQATQEGTTAIGGWTQATAEKATAVGNSAHANANQATALGHNTQATGEFSTATGVSSRASGSASVATGKNATASGDNSIATGNGSNAAGADSIASGRQASATGTGAIATGAEASASGNAAAYGNKANATGGWSSAFGNESKATATDASAFGNSANAGGVNSTAIGSHSTVTANNGSALGNYAIVSAEGGVALGQGSSSSRTALNADNVHISDAGTITSSTGISDNDIKNNKNHDVYAPVKLINDPSTLERVKNTIKGTAGAVSLGNDTTTRQLTNLAPGSADSDAVNVAQLKAVVGTIKHYNVTSKDGDITVSPDTTDPNNTVWDLKINPKYKIKYFSVKSAGGTNENNDGATGADAIAIGKDTTALRANAIAIGHEAKAQGYQNDIAIGYKAATNSEKSVAIGDNAKTDAGYSIALGTNATATVKNGIALGSESKASINNGQTGFDASQDADGARVNKYTNLTDNNQNVRTSTLAGLSIGDAAKTRQINHLAAGKADDDAVNVAQLKSVNLAFKGNSGSGDVRLHDQRLSVVGAADSFITTTASDKKLEITTTQGTFSTTDGKSSSSKQGLATTAAVASAINESGWEVQAKGTKVGLVNPGDKVNFTNADKSIEIDYSAEASGLSTIKFKAVTETIQTEEKSPITQIDVNGSTVSKTTKGENKPTGRFVVPTGDKANKYALATAYDVADKVNQTGWNLYTNGGARSLINPGDYVNFKSGNATNATVVTEASEGATISYDVNVDNTTIKIDSNGNKLTANTVDLTVNKTGNNAGKVEAPKDADKGKLVTAENVAKAVNESFWVAKKGERVETNADTTSADTNVTAGSNVTFVAGKNIALQKDGNKFIYATKDDVTFTDVTTTNTTTTNLTVKSGGNVDMGNNKVKNVADGSVTSDSKEAVNGSQLYHVMTNATAGWNLSVNNGNDKGNVKPGAQVDLNNSDGNIIISKNANNVTFNFNPNATFGVKGEQGKDGVDGSIGVNGKDGSAVAINGKDGSIGLNGKDGKNGLTIKGQDGKVGVDGKDGETRLVYVEKADPTKPGSTDKTHELATLEDGMKYGGDIGEVANVKLNKQVDIKGGVTDITKLSDNNIGVVSTPNATTGGTELTVKLAKELKGLTSAEFNDGKDKTKTEITHNGIAITPVNPANGKTSVTLTDKGLNNGGNTITNVAEGKNGTDAVNVNQLNKVEAKINEGGLTFAGNSGTPHKANLNTTVNIKGGKDNTDATQFDDGKNVMTTVNKNTVTVAIKKTPEVEGINIIDKDGKVKVKLTQTNEGLKVSDGNDKETRITNVAEGKNGTDAVNVKQLNAAKTEVTAGDNIDVVSRTGANGQTIYKVSAKGINDTSAAVKAGSNHVEVTKAANTHKDGSTTITDYTVDLSKETKEDIKKGVDAHTEVTTKGLTFNADHGTTGVKKLGSKVAVNGDGKNITTTADENGVKVSMKDDIKVNSVTAKEVKVGDVNINENGINAGGKRITNVAPGKDGTDAVNVNQLKYVAGNISNQINNVDKGLRAGIAGALASGGLYHVTTAGKSMVSVGAGTYRGQNALAVGYSRLSDNGKVGVKFTVNSNSQGHAGASASVGYQW